MKPRVFLHCDVGGRPYRIEDFRSPFEELGVIKAVSGIGPYQMSRVWMLKLRTPEAKNRLVSSGGIRVKGRYCAVIDSVKQQLTVKVYWVAFDVPNEAVRKVLSEFGDVKDVKLEEWSVPGFEQGDSTTRVARMTLRDGITADELPDLFSNFQTPAVAAARRRLSGVNAERECLNRVSEALGSVWRLHHLAGSSACMSDTGWANACQWSLSTKTLAREGDVLSNARAAVEAQVDPFDLDVLLPHLARHANLAAQQTSLGRNKRDAGLGDSELNTFRVAFRNVKCVIVDEVSMLSSDNLNTIDGRLKQITQKLN
ncbi:hypothetical protein HPB49_005910 [Dermacentor silvarum]|uniref:Uncharacterized protein n=1 Tax=Dermacentor silvarum TaxID=543639 RepID=A0ACB8DB59_DERSI|nr:hypothetical protein HPB49_005910 [Dermacentor silvarum]